jgi:hypothetical protein
LKALERKYKVEIIATRPVPGKKGLRDEDAFEELIPAKYNLSTTLTAKVSSNGKNDYSMS